jgi:predicted DNA-binding transcriptional regulator AlpA
MIAESEIIERLYSAAEIAALAGISVRAFQRLVAAGRFPAGKRLGERLIRWPAVAVREFLDGLPQAT